MSPMSKLVGVATVNDKGQIVIPASARKALGLDGGDRLLVLLACGKQGEAVGLSLLKPQALELIHQRVTEHLAEYQKVVDELADDGAMPSGKAA